MFRVPSDEGPRGPGALVLAFTHCLPTGLVLFNQLGLQVREVKGILPVL